MEELISPGGGTKGAFSGSLGFGLGAAMSKESKMEELTSPDDGPTAFLILDGAFPDVGTKLSTFSSSSACIRSRTLILDSSIPHLL